jgi:hypothetical protein
MKAKACKKAPKVQIEHKVYGPCLLVERRSTPTGNDILLVEFPDKTQRSLLAAPSFWLSLPLDLGAIPVAKTAAPEPDDVGDEIEPVTDDDVEPELVA